MEKYEYAEQVKNKLIKILSMNPQCKTILSDCKNKCSVTLNDNMELKSIKFVFWDSIYCDNKGVSIVPEHGYSVNVFNYGSFDELLKL